VYTYLSLAGENNITDEVNHKVANFTQYRYPTHSRLAWRAQS